MSFENNDSQILPTNENISLDPLNSPKTPLAHIPCVAPGQPTYSSNGPLTPIVDQNQRIISNLQQQQQQQQQQQPKIFTSPAFPLSSSSSSSSGTAQPSTGPPEIDLKAKLFAAFLKRDVRQSSAKGSKRTNASVSVSVASSPSSASPVSSSSFSIVKSTTKRKKLAVEKDPMAPKGKRGRTKRKNLIIPSPSQSPSPPPETNTLQLHPSLLTTNDTNSTPHPLSISHTPSSDFNSNFSLKLYPTCVFESSPESNSLTNIDTHFNIPKFDSAPASPELFPELKQNIDTPSLFTFVEDSQINLSSAVCSDCYIHHVPSEAHLDSTDLVASDVPNNNDAPLSYVQQYILPYVASSSRTSWQCNDCTEEFKKDSLFQTAPCSRSSISSAHSDVPQRILESYTLAEKAESCSSCLANLEIQIDAFSSSVTSSQQFIEFEKVERDLPVFKSMYSSNLFDLETMPKLHQQYSQPSPSPTPSPNDDYNLYHLDIFPCAETYHEKLIIQSDDVIGTDIDTDRDVMPFHARTHEPTLIPTTDCLYSNSSFYLH
ncbi:uncharacterized protein SAPINGB_P002230 [Magnusiomyces paraingens]|uniref:Uncharacterized protein n=1 Tax=Magnusiomyces paraingens TaxID=2606893 RepID=A0A5E8BDH4_9ASCO|nr:uncharacterized protein SAPINGB_P002230 [Saprochaete ingens]VVT49356.1 unnamed protein product [Saprochaete ingens]